MRGSVGISGSGKRVTSREIKERTKSDEWERNSSGDSNLNSDYLGTEYKYL